MGSILTIDWSKETIWTWHFGIWQKYDELFSHFFFYKVNWLLMKDTINHHREHRHIAYMVQEWFQWHESWTAFLSVRPTICICGVRHWDGSQWGIKCGLDLFWILAHWAILQIPQAFMKYNRHHVGFGLFYHKPISVVFYKKPESRL